jgi:hypothetical protein
VEAQHLHFGPGRLGLGLIVDAANKAQLVTHLISRLDSDSPQPDTYVLKLTEKEPFELEVASHSKAFTLEELEPEALKAVRANVPMLITTALGASGLTHYCDLLVKIAEERPRDSAAPTVFIACENNAGPDYEELTKQLNDLGVECRATMVNRLCPRRFIPEDDSKRIVVKADPYAEWLIEGEDSVGPLRFLAGVHYVGFEPDVTPFNVRKRWVVNGTHLALALFARPVNQPSIRSAARDPERRAQVEELQDDMVGVLPPEWEQTLGSSTEYAREQLIPICRTEDDTSRILQRLSRADLTPFLEDANRKFGEPARRFVAATGHLAASFQDVFDNLHNVLLNIDYYVDAKSIRKGKVHLSELKDREAVAAYDELLDGILDNETKKVRREQLVRRLHRHHLVAG